MLGQFLVLGSAQELQKFGVGAKQKKNKIASLNQVDVQI